MKKTLVLILTILVLSMLSVCAFAEDGAVPQAPEMPHTPEAFVPPEVPQTPDLPQNQPLEPNFQFDPGIYDYEWAMNDLNSPFNPNSPYYDPNLVFDPNVPYVPNPDTWYYGDTGVEGNLLPTLPNENLTPEERREQSQGNRNGLNEFLSAPGTGDIQQPGGEGISEDLIDEMNLAANAMRSLRIKSNVKADSEVELGQEIILTAIPMGYNVNYNLQWQYAEIDANGNIGRFHNVEGETGLTYIFRIDEQNINYIWRAVIQVVA